MNMQMICRQPVDTVSMDPANAERLLDDEALKKKEPESIHKKERPADKGVFMACQDPLYLSIQPLICETSKNYVTKL